MTKQYLMILDDTAMAIIGQLIPCIKYLEVEGISVPSCQDFKLLANPTPKAAETPQNDENKIE